MKYQIPVFIADPDYCAVTYSYTITDSAGEAAIVLFNPDPSVREFTFGYSTDLDLCGPTSTEYNVTVIGEVGSVNKQTDS